MAHQKNQGVTAVAVTPFLMEIDFTSQKSLHPPPFHRPCAILVRMRGIPAGEGVRWEYDPIDLRPCYRPELSHRPELITRRSQVQILAPLPNKSKGCGSFP